MTTSNFKSFLRFFLLLIWGVCVWYVLDQIHARGIWFFLVMALGVFSFLDFLWLFKTKEIKLPDPSTTKTPTVIWVGLSAFGLVVLFLSFQWRVQIFNNAVGRLLAALLFAGAGAVVLRQKGSGKSVFLDFAALLLGYGIVYRVVGFLPEIQTGAFALGWSEGSRFYNASTFVSEELYGQKLPLPVLHPSRYLMQALPFFVGVRDILAHRVWQVVLWLGVTLWGSWLVAKRFHQGLKIPLWQIVAFCVLFFFQGAVYYHLMFVVILVLIGYKRDKPFQTLVFVVLASIWAGISRINWLPVPGLLAMTLYLIDQPITPKRWMKYLVWPAVWTFISLAVGLASKQLYIQISGENPALFDSAFSSPLLWYRLWPNATFFLGILPAIALVCVPLTALVIGEFRSGLGRRVFWLRWLLLIGILAAFFVGGVLVSLKIGGGGDLHNLDAFLVFFLLVCLSILAGKVTPDVEITQESHSFEWRPLWLMLALVIPIFFNLINIGGRQMPSGRNDQADLATLNQAVALVSGEPGDVLFIAERQLLTFESVDYNKVVVPYEKVFLMEMAMGENREFLREFYRTLESHTYSMIVTDSINEDLQGRDRSFSDENNMWVQLVLEPMLQYYEPAVRLQDGNVNLLIPRGNSVLLEQLKTLGN
ncbi:MAG: hypothetical protein WBI14_01745 [Anaerolineaceae bacterium]